MKKILPALVVLLALGAAGATVFFVQRQRTGAASSSAALGYLPADTLLLFSLPDPRQVAEDWRGSDLSKLWNEPTVQEFFAKPLSKMQVNNDLNELLPQIERVGPHNLFVALTALDEKTSEPHFVAGFQFKGSNADVEKLLQKPKDDLRKGSPAGKADLIKYQEHSLETFTTGNGKTVASTYLDDWYLVSNDVELLKATLDHADHRAPAGQTTLDADADFKTVLARMPSNPATLIFARPRVAFDRIFALAATSGQAMSEEQVAEVRKIKAVAATTAFDHGKLRDTIYTLAPGHKQYGALQLSALPLTSADTLAFYAAVLQIPEHLEPSANPAAPAGPGAAGYAMLGQFADQLKARGITLESFNAAFGHELSVQLDWPSASGQPSLVVALDVHDSAAAAKLLDESLKTLPTGLNWQVSNADGLTFRSLSLPTMSLVTPTLTLTDKHLIVGLSAAGVRAVAAREKAGGANFTASEAYKAAAGTVVKADVATIYIDAKPLFERTYATLKPLAMFGAAFAGPQVNDYVDLSKLPDGEAISRHLSPIVLSEKSDDQGILLESVGPVTGIQASVGIGVAAAAAAAPMLQKQIATAAGHHDEPESTPQPSPGE